MRKLLSLVLPFTFMLLFSLIVKADEQKQQNAGSPSCSDKSLRDQSFCAADENYRLNEKLTQLERRILRALRNNKQQSMFKKEIKRWRKSTSQFCIEETKELESNTDNVYWALANYGCLNNQTELRIKSLEQELNNDIPNQPLQRDATPASRLRAPELAR